MKIDSWYATDKGLKRHSNQDSCMINKDLGLFVVADGMGGHSGGEVASAMAVEIVEEVMLQPGAFEMPPTQLIQQCYQEASHRIYDKAAHENPELLGMGTTMVLALVRGRTVYIANVGDSRCYLIKNRNIWQLTEDHSLVNEHRRGGIMSEEQIKQFVGKNVITRSVGFERDVLPDIIERDIQEDEMLLLCSDGLTGLVTDEALVEIINNNSAEIAIKKSIEQALANGGHDNVTVMLIHFHN